jgi:hypothetical protein
MTYDDVQTEERRLAFVNQNSTEFFKISFSFGGDVKLIRGRYDRVLLITTSLEELHDVISMIRMETVRRMLVEDSK